VVSETVDGVAQVVECLPSKNRVLSSNPSAAKKKKKRKWSLYSSYANNSDQAYEGVVSVAVEL
jgi:hypothetical protein